VAVEGYSPLKRTNLANPVLAKIAAAHDATASQVVLRWHVEHGMTVLVKSAQPERIAANIDVVRFSLSPDEVARIDALSR
jgi:diketogulonate reductase-like aldo/keto reductase